MMPRLAAAMARLLGPAAAHLVAREILPPTPQNVVDDRLLQRRLVVLQRQHVVPFRGDDRLSETKLYDALAAASRPADDEEIRSAFGAGG